MTGVEIKRDAQMATLRISKECTRWITPCGVQIVDNFHEFRPFCRFVANFQ
jgi:hypothetical protein